VNLPRYTEKDDQVDMPSGSFLPKLSEVNELNPVSMFYVVQLMFFKTLIKQLKGMYLKKKCEKMVKRR